MTGAVARRTPTLIDDERQTPVSDRPTTDPTSWPPQFPHTEIDELIQRLSDGADAGAEDAERLLQLIAREAERLRRTVTKLSVSRLSAAEREAHEIVSRANDHADDVRNRALTVLDDRLDEADTVVRAMRRSFLVEHRLRGSSTQAPRPPFACDSDTTAGPERDLS